MLAVLAGLVPFLPVLLQIIGWGLKLFGSSAETLRQYEKMIEDANKAGLLSVESHDRLLSHKKTIEERIKAKSEKPGA